MSKDFKYLGILENKVVYQDGDKLTWGTNFETPVGSDAYKSIIGRVGVVSNNKKGYQKYFERSRNIHKESVKRFQELKGTMDAIEENYNNIMSDPAISIIAKEKEKAYFERCKAGYNKDYEIIKADMEEKLNGVYTEMEKDVNAFYTPTGADIDADTLSLINSGIKLTGAEFDRMAEKHADNYTMSRLLSDYAVKNDIKTNKSITLLQFMGENQVGNNTELNTIKSLHDVTRQAINDGDTLKSRVRIENYDGIYNDHINTMNSTPVRIANYEKIGFDLNETKADAE